MQQPHGLRLWGVLGALLAALFSVWMLFFPDLVAPRFAWVVEPRLAQVFIGAGYAFRTAFFLAFVVEPRWDRMRWAYWGNLAFTGTLLLATFWHVEELSWFSVFAHIWIIAYVLEPVSMIYRVPRGADSGVATPSDSATPRRAPIWAPLRLLLIIEVAMFGTVGALLVINPQFVDLRWPWALNPFDARIVAAWFIGWATWAGTMAFAADWAEIRIGIACQIIFGVALLATIFAFRGLFDFGAATTPAYVVLTGLITVLMLGFYWRHERM
jgi:hypothetical protein